MLSKIKQSQFTYSLVLHCYELYSFYTKSKGQKQRKPYKLQLVPATLKLLRMAHIFSIQTHFFLIILVVATSSKKPKALRRFKSDRDEIWQDCSSTEYASIMTESDFRFDMSFLIGSTFVYRY